MRVLLLNGATGPDALLDDLAARLRETLTLRGAEVDTVLLRIEPMAWCQGCFECWTHTPGVCKIDDIGRDLARDFAEADAVMLLTPSRFGSYSPDSKKLLDRTLGMLLPFFRQVQGETHHAPRYPHRPAFGVLGVLAQPDFDEEATLRTLVARNALNFAAPRASAAIVTRRDSIGASLGACDALIEDLFGSDRLEGEQLVSDRLQNDRRQTKHVVDQSVGASAAATGVTSPSIAARVGPVVHPDVTLPAMPRQDAHHAPRRALLLIGSAKPRGHSTSEALGLDLMERLALAGVEGDVRHVHRDAHDDAGVLQLVTAIRSVDLLVIASPIYLDALPWLVTRALGAIATDRAQSAEPSPLAIAMLLNCGFPEARHASVGRTIGALFARDARAQWAGALQIGGGGVIDGRPLAELGAPVRHLLPVLAAAANELARGERLSDDTLAAAQQPLLSPLAYRLAADAAWLWTAAHHGTILQLKQR